MTPSWMRKALCRGSDSELFFLGTRAANAAAQKICRNCPVKEDCGQWAFESGDKHAVLGGMTVRQRTVIRNRMRKLIPGSDRAPGMSVPSPKAARIRS